MHRVNLSLALALVLTNLGLVLAFALGGCTAPNPDYLGFVPDLAELEAATMGDPGEAAAVDQTHEESHADLTPAPTDDLTPAPRVPLASCNDLPRTCGGAGSDDCCANIALPAGIYNRSNDGAFAAALSPFRLDRYEVTVGRFRAFLQAGEGTQQRPPRSGEGAHPTLANSGWAPDWNRYLTASTVALRGALHCEAQATWTDEPAGGENAPINCVMWYEAFAFCAWDGGRLPTEAEWNYAAAGGAEQRPYPWAAAIIDASRAIYNSNAVALVGSRSPRGDGKWGHADMAGNVTEFVLDWYAVPYADKQCFDCANLTPSTDRSYRGGNWRDPPGSLLTYTRGAGQPGARASIIGFRCAR